MTDLNKNPNQARQYIGVMIFTFLVGIILYLFSHAQIDKLSNSLIESIADKNTAAIFKGYFENKESDSVWTMVSEFSIFLSASVVVHLIYFFFIKKEEFRTIQALKTQFHDETKKAIGSVVHGIHKWGFVAFCDEMEFPKLFDQLQADDELLWLDTYCPHINKSSLSITNAIKRGAKIKMLVMDPKSEALPWRAKEILPDFDSKEEIFREQITTFIKRIDHTKTGCADQESLTYRTYSDLPGNPIYIIKKANGAIKVYTGFYLSQASADFVHIEWTGAAENTGLAGAFLKYFDAKWERWAPK